MATNRFDYSDVRVIRERARIQQIRRGGPAVHPYVIGRFVLDRGRVVLSALASVAWVVDGMTDECRKMARWRTRQGAHQWLTRHPQVGDLSVWFLDRLDVASEDVKRENVKRGLTGCQPAGGLTACQPREEERYRAAEARAGDTAKLARLMAARATIEKYKPPGRVDAVSTVTTPEQFTVEDAARFLARTEEDVEWILRAPISYRVCARAAEARVNGDAAARRKLDQAKALLEAFHAIRPKR